MDEIEREKEKLLKQEAPPTYEEFEREMEKTRQLDPPSEKGLHQVTRRLMRRLSEEGLSPLGGDTPSPPTKVTNDPFHVRRDPVPGEARSVTLPNGQTVWLQVGERVVPKQRYKSIKVFSKTSSSDEAIVAALMIKKAQALRQERVVKRADLSARLIKRQKEEFERIGFSDSPTVEEEKRALDAMSKLLQEPDLEGATPFDAHPAVEESLGIIEDVLRLYRPRLDELSEDDRVSLIKHLSHRVHEALEAWRKVMEFVEYGTPEGKLRPTIKDATQDVRAAELRDVQDLSHKEVAEISKDTPTEASVIKNDYPTTRARINRGRELLEKAYGKDGWEELANDLKDDAARYANLPEPEQHREAFVSWHAEVLGITRAQSLALVARMEEDAVKRGESPESVWNPDIAGRLADLDP